MITGDRNAEIQGRKREKEIASGRVCDYMYVLMFSTNTYVCVILCVCWDIYRCIYYVISLYVCMFMYVCVYAYLISSRVCAYICMSLCMCMHTFMLRYKWVYAKLYGYSFSSIRKSNFLFEALEDSIVSIKIFIIPSLFVIARTYRTVWQVMF